jgi:eukaryotic-like serine/threonine-protein kinase
MRTASPGPRRAVSASCSLQLESRRRVAQPTKRVLPARIKARYAAVVVPLGTLTLAGRYRLISPLREGGMGKVWTAEHLSLHSMVAVKLIDEELASRPDAVARFLREARAAAQIRSPHIVQVFDVGIDNGVPFLAMELLQGESLAERLQRVGRLSPADTARFLSQVARGIARAHGVGLVHRDLKPDNVFLEKNDEEELAKVLDFGVAKALIPGFDTESGATRTGALVGSPHYMSPEQAEASTTLDHRTDIWSFGVMAFECLTGMKPFNQSSLGSQVLAICAWPMPVPSRISEVPIDFDAWFARACSRSPAARFGSIQEAAQSLSQVCQSASQSARAALSATLPGTGADTSSTPRSDSLRTVAPISSLPPRLSWLAQRSASFESFSALRGRAKLAAAGALMVILVVSLLAWRLVHSTPAESPALPSSASNTRPNSEPQARPAASERAPESTQLGASGGASPQSPLAPAPERAAPLEATETTKKPSPRLTPRRRVRATFDAKEDPY